MSLCFSPRASRSAATSRPASGNGGVSPHLLQQVDEEAPKERGMLVVAQASKERGEAGGWGWNPQGSSQRRLRLARTYHQHHYGNFKYVTHKHEYYHLATTSISGQECSQHPNAVRLRPQLRVGSGSRSPGTSCPLHRAGPLQGTTSSMTSPGRVSATAFGAGRPGGTPQGVTLGTGLTM